MEQVTLNVVQVGQPDVTQVADIGTGDIDRIVAAYQKAADAYLAEMMKNSREVAEAAAKDAAKDAPKAEPLAEVDPQRGPHVWVASREQVIGYWLLDMLRYTNKNIAEIEFTHHIPSAAPPLRKPVPEAPTKTPFRTEKEAEKPSLGHS